MHEVYNGGLAVYWEQTECPSKLNRELRTKDQEAENPPPLGSITRRSCDAVESESSAALSPPHLHIFFEAEIALIGLRLGALLSTLVLLPGCTSSLFNSPTDAALHSRSRTRLCLPQPPNITATKPPGQEQSLEGQLPPQRQSFSETRGQRSLLLPLVRASAVVP